MLRIKTIDIEIIRYRIFFCVWVGNSPSAPHSGPTFKVQCGSANTGDFLKKVPSEEGGGKEG